MHSDINAVQDFFCLFVLTTILTNANCSKKKNTIISVSGTPELLADCADGSVYISHIFLLVLYFPCVVLCAAQCKKGT